MHNVFSQGFRVAVRDDGLFCGSLRTSVRASRLPAGSQRMARRGRRMLRRAMTDGLWRAGGHRGELAGRWHAGSRRMLRRALAGGWWRVGRWHAERSTYVTREAGGWRAGGKERRRRQIAARNADGLCAQGDEDIGLRQQMLRRKRADGAWGGGGEWRAGDWQTRHAEGRRVVCV